MTLIVKVNEEISLLIDFNMEKEKVSICSTCITNNSSLIRYLLKLLDIDSISENKSGYMCLRRNDRTKTSLQRIIMEFYLKYDKDNKIDFTNKEIDHINNEKSDNRTSNFQILTKSNNNIKKYCNSYDIEVTNEYIMGIDKEIRELKQYKIDEEYLERLSENFYKIIENGNLENIDSWQYLDLSSTLIQKEILNNTNIIRVINSIIIKVIEVLTNFHKDFIYRLYQLDKSYILTKILKSNLQKLNRYSSRYKYLEEILKKNILESEELDINHFNFDTKELLNNKRYIDLYDFQYLFDNMSNTKNILKDLYEKVKYNKSYSIRDDNILTSIDIRFEFDKKGKYSTFRILYLLGLLKRRKSKRRKSFIEIPIYTDELLKEANRIAKKILDLKLRKITYFIVAEEFGIEVANMVYGERSKQLEVIYKRYSIKAKEDIIEFIRNDEQIRNVGYTTVEEIFEYIENLNAQRRLQGLEYNPIYNGFRRFITTLLNYNTQTKTAMKESGFEYRNINKDIKENIIKYQKKRGLSNTIMEGIRDKNKIIVLSKLVK